MKLSASRPTYSGWSGDLEAAMDLGAPKSLAFECGIWPAAKMKDNPARIKFTTREVNLTELDPKTTPFIIQTISLMTPAFNLSIRSLSVQVTDGLPSRQAFLPS